MKKLLPCVFALFLIPLPAAAQQGGLLFDSLTRVAVDYCPKTSSPIHCGLDVSYLALSAVPLDMQMIILRGAVATGDKELGERAYKGLKEGYTNLQAQMEEIERKYPLK